MLADVVEASEEQTGRRSEGTFAAGASAQWAWKDDNGRLVYSNIPPPPSIKATQIVRQPGPSSPGARAAAPVEGESTRNYHDGKPHLNLLGYWVYTKQVQQGANQRYKAASSSLIVVRQADAATGSLYSLLNNGKLDVKATVQVYRAGGNAQSTQAEPVIEIIASDARIYCISSYTSKRLRQPCDIVVFAHRKLEIKTAPQQASGLRGAVRTCAMTS